MIQENETTHIVSPPETYDSPTERVTINQLNVQVLDAWLDGIRQRRLVQVQRLEAAAKVKSDAVRLTTFLKYERQYASAKRALGRLDEMITRVEAIVHKTRVLAMACEMEVSDEEELEDADTST